MSGAAALASAEAAALTDEQKSQWRAHVDGLWKTVHQDGKGIFTDLNNAVFESACESAGTCGLGQYGLKPRLLAAIWRVPLYIRDLETTAVDAVLEGSAKAALRASSMVPVDSEGLVRMCGFDWTKGEDDEIRGAGPQGNALQAMASLIAKYPEMWYPGMEKEPIRGFTGVKGLLPEGYAERISDGTLDEDEEFTPTDTATGPSGSPTGAGAAVGVKLSAVLAAAGLAGLL